MRPYMMFTHVASATNADSLNDPENAPIHWLAVLKSAVSELSALHFSNGAPPESDGSDASPRRRYDHG